VLETAWSGRHGGSLWTTSRGRVHLGAELGHEPAVDADTALKDQLFRLAARGHARPGKGFLQAFRFGVWHGSASVTHLADCANSRCAIPRERARCPVGSLHCCTKSATIYADQSNGMEAPLEA
jgi:hypothetical protein